MRGVGTEEPFIQEDVQAMAVTLGHSPRTIQWRKPVSIEEINRMAPTAEVRERKGRP